MARMEIITCDWCGINMTNERNSHFINAMRYYISDNKENTGNQKLMVEADLCSFCSERFIDLVNDRKEVKKGRDNEK